MPEHLQNTAKVLLSDVLQPQMLRVLCLGQLLNAIAFVCSKLDVFVIKAEKECKN